MRIGMLVATVGMMVGAPGVAISVAPAAMAQEAGLTVSTAERQLEAQFVALAQAGDTAGIQALVRSEVAAGRAQLVARVSRRVAQMGSGLAGSDAAAATALVQAAVVMASDSSVAAADGELADDVGASAASAVNTMVASDPERAAAIQVSVATSASASLQIAYVNASNNVNTNQTGPTTTTQQTPIVPRRFAPPPVEPAIPDIIEPNPAQTGSPT